MYTNFEPLSKERTIQQLKTQMFREYWLGVIPPSKQLVGLPDTEVELKSSSPASSARSFSTTGSSPSA